MAQSTGQRSVRGCCGIPYTTHPLLLFLLFLLQYQTDMYSLWADELLAPCVGSMIPTARHMPARHMVARHMVARHTIARHMTARNMTARRTIARHGSETRQRGPLPSATARRHVAKCDKSGILILIKFLKLMYGKFERCECLWDQYDPLTDLNNTWQESVMTGRPGCSLAAPL